MRVTAQVYCQECKEFHNVKDVEFVGIEEDIHGRDVMTYVCPETQKEVKGIVVSKR